MNRDSKILVVVLLVSLILVPMSVAFWKTCSDVQKQAAIPSQANITDFCKEHQDTEFYRQGSMRIMCSSTGDAYLQWEQKYTMTGDVGDNPVKDADGYGMLSP